MSEIEIFRKALEEIAALENVTQTKGLLEHDSTPEYLVQNGWGPIHPQMKRGLNFAAKIAIEALKMVKKDES